MFSTFNKINFLIKLNNIIQIINSLLLLYILFFLNKNNVIILLKNVKYYLILNYKLKNDL